MTRPSTRTSTLERKLTLTCFAIRQFPHRMMRDPGGGLVQVETALVEMAQLRQGICAQRHGGARLHDKITAFQRFLVGALPLLDGAVLFWFLVGVLNVDLRRFDLLMVIAVGLALIATLAVAAWNAALGRRLQVAKNDSGGVMWDAVDGLERIMLAISGIVMLLIGAMMFVRVADEVYLATGVTGTASTVIALTLAAAIVVLNLYVLYLAFADGSEATRRADGLARRLRPHVRRLERDQTRAASLREQIRQAGGGGDTGPLVLPARP